MFQVHRLYSQAVMATSFRRLLKRARERARLTKSEFARRLDVTFTTVHDWEAGKSRPPPLERVTAIVKVLGIERGDAALVQRAATIERASPESAALIRRLQAQRTLDHDSPRPEQRRSVPLYGDVPAGPPVAPAEAIEVYPVLAHLAKANRYVLRVMGDSMAPTLQPGDLVVMEYVDQPNLAKLNNRICAVMLDGDSTLKRIQIQKAGQHTVIILKGDRADYPTESFVLGRRDFEIQGVAVAIVERKLTP